MTQERSELNSRAAVVEGETGPIPGAVADALAENGESLGRALRILSRMEQEGTLQELADVLALVKLIKEALTDDMVIGLAQRAQHLAAAATDPAVAALAGRLPAALRAAEAAAATAAPPPTLSGLLRQMRDPEVRRGLAYVLNLARHLPPPTA